VYFCRSAEIQRPHIGVAGDMNDQKNSLVTSQSKSEKGASQRQAVLLSFEHAYGSLPLNLAIRVSVRLSHVALSDSVGPHLYSITSDLLQLSSVTDKICSVRVQIVVILFTDWAIVTITRFHRGVRSMGSVMDYSNRRTVTGAVVVGIAVICGRS
jgi:hypothetical protein